MIMLIFKKTIVFVQSARETCGCTRLTHADFVRIRGAGSARAPWCAPILGPSAMPSARGATHARGAHAGPRLLLFGAVVGVCLTERALKRTNKNLHFRSLRCNVAGDAC